MRLLAFSDLHCDLGRARDLVGRSARADAVIAAGDFAKVHQGLEGMIGILERISAPTVLVPGNNETEEALRSACEGWETATVLHGERTQLDGVPVFGLGAGIPITPWDWSFDLGEEDAGEALADCPEEAILVLHSPPKGHVDQSSDGQHLGSTAILGAIERTRPRVAVCGHIHESWGRESEIAGSRVLNLGPEGTWIEV